MKIKINSHLTTFCYFLLKIEDFVYKISVHEPVTYIYIIL